MARHSTPNNFYHRRTLLGCMIRGRWCVRHIHRHIVRHSQKYILVGLVWMAFFMLGADFIASIHIALPEKMVDWIHHNRWVGLLGAFLSHVTAMLERVPFK